MPTAGGKVSGSSRLQDVEDVDELDNTLIMYISGDNGGSAEGMLDGTPNEFTFFNGVQVPVKDQFLWYPFWDRNDVSTLRGWLGMCDEYAVQVVEAGSVALRRNGTGVGMRGAAISRTWAASHVNSITFDIVLTILEVTGIPEPETIDGIKRRGDRWCEHSLFVGQAYAEGHVKQLTRSKSCSRHCGWVAPRHGQSAWRQYATPPT